MALPVGTDNSAAPGGAPMTLAKGFLENASDVLSLAQTGQQSGRIFTFSRDGLTTGEIEANTWTLALAMSEAHANANSFLAVSLYLWGARVYPGSPGQEVLGYVYDSATPLGAEWGTTEDGQVVTFSGAEIGGVVPADWLVLEIWYVATQATATSYLQSIYYAGTADVTGSTTSDAASYLETPQDLFPDPSGGGEDGFYRTPRVRADRFG